MKLIKRSYKAICKRGALKDIDIFGWMDKIEEESKEVLEAYKIGDSKPNAHMIEEVIDLITVCLNFLYHYNINIAREFMRGIIKNENRDD